MPILRWHCTSHVSHQRTSAASAASEPAAYTLNMSGTTQVINNGLNKYKQATTLSETKVKAVWSVPSNYLSIYAIQLLKLGPQPHTLASKNVHCSDNTHSLLQVHHMLIPPLQPPHCWYHLTTYSSSSCVDTDNWNWNYAVTCWIILSLGFLPAIKRQNDIDGLKVALYLIQKVVTIRTVGMLSALVSNYF